MPAPGSYCEVFVIEIRILSSPKVMGMRMVSVLVDSFPLLC